MIPDESLITMDAGLWFRYGGQRREGIVSNSTFDAVLCGERTSTTRFHAWPGHAAWSRLRVGGLVRFHEKKDHDGRTLVVEVTGISEINLWTCTAEEIECWSRHEGWSVNKGRCLGQQLGPALWLRHRLLWPSPVPPAAPFRQMSLF
jgi:hypothetical protein